MPRSHAPLLATAALLGLALAAGCTGCARAKPKAEAPPRPLPFAGAGSVAPATKTWSAKLSGLITDIAFSRDGSAVLVATAPDHDSEPAAGGYHLWRFDGESGKRVWKGESKGPVRSLALSDDGSLGYSATYGEEITALRPAGSEAWSLPSMCKPIPLGAKARFLCYHDDDAGSDVAFDLYSPGKREPKRVLSFPVEGDVLALKVSEDERNAAIGLTGGRVILFDPAYRAAWRAKVGGEIIDLAVSSGDRPRVVVLHDLKPRKGGGRVRQLMTLFDARGRRVAEGETPRRAEQIELAPSGAAAAVYGNDESGQHVEYFALPRPGGKAAAAAGAAANAAPAPLAPKWSAGDAHPADYSSSITVTEGLILFGFEDVSATSRHSHLIGLDPEGRLAFDVPLKTDEGAYLYGYALARDASVALVATDDGVISAYPVPSIER